VDSERRNVLRNMGRWNQERRGPTERNPYSLHKNLNRTIDDMSHVPENPSDQLLQLKGNMTDMMYRSKQRDIQRLSKANLLMAKNTEAYRNSVLNNKLIYQRYQDEAQRKEEDIQMEVNKFRAYQE